MVQWLQLTGVLICSRDDKAVGWMIRSSARWGRKMYFPWSLIIKIYITNYLNAVSKINYEHGSGDLGDRSLAWTANWERAVVVAYATNFYYLIGTHRVGPGLQPKQAETPHQWTTPVASGRCYHVNQVVSSFYSISQRRGMWINYRGSKDYDSVVSIQDRHREGRVSVSNLNHSAQTIIFANIFAFGRCYVVFWGLAILPMTYHMREYLPGPRPRKRYASNIYARWF